VNQLKYERIMGAVTALPWAILPAKLAAIQAVLLLRAQGERLTEEEIQARVGAALARPAVVGGGAGLAVLPLVGTIVPRGGMFTEASGAVSVSQFAQQLRQALSDPDIGAIVIDVDSPGGQVGGVAELADELFAARGRKPIVAQVNHLAASAAYWLASAADQVVVSPSGEVGSIGVFAMHQDVSQALEREGVRVNLISAGRYKVEGNPFGPLTDEARQAMQGRVDEYYEMFVSAVARQRGAKRSDVRDGFGEGRVVGAAQAVRLGMADRVATLDETVARLAGGRRRGRMSASVDFRRRRLRLAEGTGSDETGPRQ
jgi:capsid assembly protease